MKSSKNNYSVFRMPILSEKITGSRRKIKVNSIPYVYQDIVNICDHVVNSAIDSFKKNDMELSSIELLESIVFNYGGEKKEELRKSLYDLCPYLKIKFDVKLNPITIIDVVCKYHDIGIHDITLNFRDRYIVEPRQIAMYFIRKISKTPFKKIGEIFGKDHSTVIHACKLVENLVDNNKEYENKIVQIQNILENEKDKQFNSRKFDEAV